MDLYEKLRLLETELYDAKPVPLSKKKSVDTEKCLELLHDIKRAIPDDVYDLNRLAAEKKRLIQIADDNLARMSKTAEKVLTEAEARAAVIVDQSNLVRESEREAEHIKRLALRDIEVAELKTREKLAGVLLGVQDYLQETLSLLKRTQADLGVEIDRGKKR